MKKIGRKKGYRILLCLGVSGLLLIGIYCLRKGAHSSFFALADGLSISGFFTLLFSCLPSLFSGEVFDGIAYVGRFAIVGWIPSMAQSYSAHKAFRAEKRKRGYFWEGILVGGAFLSIGLLFCLFFV